MNPRTPSFHTLYLHSRPKMQPNEEKVMEQWERFAVASLASVLEHDLDLRTAFLERVCEWTGPGDAKDFALYLEMTNCGDFALASPASGIVFVIECKINAPLQPNQIPSTGIAGKDVFFDSGYGAGIRKEFANFRQRTYTVLSQSDAAIPNPRPRELKCTAKSWENLLACGAKSSLAKDLFESLAQFHIHCFAHRITQNMKLISSALGACRITTLLVNAAKLAGWPDSGEDMQLETANSGYIGRFVRRKDAPKKWRDFISPADANPNDHLTWFGYQDSTRSVGFYCALRKVPRVRKALELHCGSLGTVDEDRDYVWIESDEKQPLGDQEWFVEVYGRMRQAVAS